MKNLQDKDTQRIHFQAPAFMDLTSRIPSKPQEVILLLHGLGERGKRIYRKFVSSLPENAAILAPNGIYPLPSVRNGETRYTYAWYFYDRASQSYLINQDLPVAWLGEMIRSLDLDHLPLTIIGFSQGGYLAPFVGQSLPQTKHVIGIGCEFRTPLLKDHFDFKMTAIHGTEDKIILPEWAEKEVKELKARGVASEFHLVPGVGHEINSEIVKQILNVIRK
ncbi:MAG: alpha/beta hydrolase [Bacteriovoracaceae bacterium]